MNPYIFNLINISKDPIPILSFEVFEICPSPTIELYTEEKFSNIKKSVYITKENNKLIRIIGIFYFKIFNKGIEPLNELQEYFSIYHENKIPENLNPYLREKWFIAQIADNIAYNIFKTGDYYEEKI